MAEMSAIRIRQILPKLNYDHLVKDGLIPDLAGMTKSFINAYQTKRYPPFVYETQCYSEFGMFMDYMLRASLRLHVQQTFDLGSDPFVNRIQNANNEEEMIVAMSYLSIYESSKSIDDIGQAVYHLFGNLPFDSGVVQRYIGTLVNTTKDLVVLWNKYSHYLSGTVRYNHEFSHKNIVGHPDLITDNCILDIKTTTSFDKMAKESCLQILAYHALSGKHRYVGFVLPIQRDIIICDLQGWNSSKYLQVLLDNTVEQIDLTSILERLTTDVQRIKVGGHIEKGKNIEVTFREHARNCPDRPCQLFLSNPRSGKRDAKLKDQVIGAANIIKSNNLQFFTHAPYIINLCANCKDEKTGEFWQQRILNDDLKTTVELGGKGVVVHVGARRCLTEEVALKNMEDMVRNALQYATESCPLLLETPCGEGTEVCTSVSDLAKFYTRFSEEEQKKLGLCVDSCHTFVCSYDPLEYMKEWTQISKIPIVLVHFNDSRGEKGSRLDRHAPCGRGHIGAQKMEEIAIWCYNRKIPLVQE